MQKHSTLVIDEQAVWAGRKRRKVEWEFVWPGNPHGSCTEGGITRRPHYDCLDSCFLLRWNIF